MTTELSENAQSALKKAEQIARAIEKKMPGYVAFVRHYLTPEYSFVEIGVNKKGDVPANEVQVAYSEQFYLEMTTPEETLKRARRMLRDVRLHFNLPLED